jgi:hypothetical protein
LDSDGQQTAYSVEKLRFEKSSDFICDLSHVAYCRYEGVAEGARKTDLTRLRTAQLICDLRARRSKKFIEISVHRKTEFFNRIDQLQSFDKPASHLSRRNHACVPLSE